MEMIKIISQLNKIGHNIKYRKRTDGGYIITSINGVKYSGAKGNAVARSMLGVTLSPKRQAQTLFNVNKYIRAKKKPKGLTSTQKSALTRLKKLTRKTQKVWREQGTKSGKISFPKVRYIYKTFGYKKAKEYLSRMELYALGIAYPDNVRHLIDYINRFALNFPNKANEITALTLAIERKINTFKEKWIEPLYNLWYGVREEGDVNLIINLTLHIINK